MPLAVTGAARHPLLNDVPTFDESGFKGFDGVQWYGVVGPAGLPAPIVKRLNDEINAMLAEPEMRERLSGEAVEPMPMSPDQFAQYIRDDIARWIEARTRAQHPDRPTDAWPATPRSRPTPTPRRSPAAWRGSSPTHPSARLERRASTPRRSAPS